MTRAISYESFSCLDVQGVRIHIYFLKLLGCQCSLRLVLGWISLETGWTPHQQVSTPKWRNWQQNLDFCYMQMTCSNDYLRLRNYLCGWNVPSVSGIFIQLFTINGQLHQRSAIPTHVQPPTLLDLWHNDSLTRLQLLALCHWPVCGNSMHGQADAPGISESNIVGWPLCTENQKLSPARGSENLQPFGGMAQPPKERKAHCNLHEFIEIIKRESAACDNPTIRRRKPYTGQEKKGCSPCKQLFKIN